MIFVLIFVHGKNEGNTEEENTGHVVFERNTHESTGK